MLNRNTAFSFCNHHFSGCCELRPTCYPSYPTAVMGVLVSFNLVVLVIYQFCSKDLSQSVSVFRRFGIDHMVSVVTATFIACMASTQILNK